MNAELPLKATYLLLTRKRIHYRALIAIKWTYFHGRFPHPDESLKSSDVFFSIRILAQKNILVFCNMLYVLTGEFVNQTRPCKKLNSFEI